MYKKYFLEFKEFSIRMNPCKMNVCKTFQKKKYLNLVVLANILNVNK